MTRASLTPDQEQALHTLETTRDYAAGEAALGALKDLKGAAVVLEVLLGFAIWAGLVLAWLAIERALIPNSGVSFAAVGAGLLLFGVARLVARRRSPEWRITSARNRWRQIAGALAVQSRTGTPS
ncbi:MAG: hypothetical protein KJS97_01565 [Alphaproteobacteria bacterium]|nr:hypothetical protein [Alphaproteobacteria bacterium]